MPSDALTIMVALAAPSVAGIVAVVIHRQRLVHERRQTDLEALRSVLAEGAALVTRMAQLGSTSKQRMERSPADRRAVINEAIEAFHTWTNWSGGLLVLLPQDHPVAKASGEVFDVIYDLPTAIEGPEETLDSELERLNAAVETWLARARDTAQAALPSPRA